MRAIELVWENPNLIRKEQGLEMTDLADITRRIELERSDAARNELAEAIRGLESLSEKYDSESYRKAWKAGIAFLRSRLTSIA